LTSRIGTFTTQLGECPIWDAAEQRLWLLDCRRGLILRVDPVNANCTSLALPPPLGSLALCAGGRLIVALKETIELVDPDTGDRQVLARIDDSHLNLRLNDGVALPDGSFLVGTMHVPREPEEQPLGGIYHLRIDGRLHKLAGGFGITNGPRIDPTTGRLYVCDTEQRLIFSYAWTEDRHLTDRRIFASTAPWQSGPDGCCFDQEGGLWTALVRVGALARFDREGRLTDRIDLPLTHPTALCFGGLDLSEIFVTSIQDSGRLRGDRALDGALLRVDTGGRFHGYPSALCSIDDR
jgi:sugar lactone lactonase YvrE